MKLIYLYLSLCFASLAANAQHKAEVIVSYDESSRNWETDTIKNQRMTLLANNYESKYFNDLSLWSDSLSSTPAGKEQLDQIIIAACLIQTPDGGIVFNRQAGPIKRIFTYVFTNLNNGNMRYYDKFGDEEMFYDESFDDMQWQITDSTTNILGYECIAAETDYHGRHWTAWFTAEIPLQFGPWKLHGLPGLILRAESDNETVFTATGVEHSDRIITPMYSNDMYQKVDRKKALANHEHYVNNRENIIKAKHGGSVQFNYDASKRPKFDAKKYALEPDYKN